MLNKYREYANGTIAANYGYDAWGKVTAITDADGNAITAPTHIANANPIRYRGYYYDTETGFYYLRSRYYDPEICRFINADALASTGQGLLGYNMYAYCNNDPVNCSDPSGEIALIDYYWMHKGVQIECVLKYGFAMEIYVSGDYGAGFPDLYDVNANEYYEVKSIGAAELPTTEKQMKRYGKSSVYATGAVPNRGTQDISGQFQYRGVTVSYKTSEPGLIVYEPSDDKFEQSILDRALIRDRIYGNTTRENGGRYPSKGAVYAPAFAAGAGCGAAFAFSCGGGGHCTMYSLYEQRCQ